MKKNMIIGMACTAMLLLSGCGEDPVAGPVPSCETQPELCGISTIAVSSAVLPSSASVVPVTGYAQLPSVANPLFADLLYDQWKAMYVRPQTAEPSGALPATAGSARIIWDTQTYTVSEGIGYGMLNAYFQGDYVLLNQLWLYSTAFRTPGYHLMPWKVKYFSTVSDKTSATDADIDIATSLILAYLSTGNEVYRADALAIVKDIWDYEILSSNLMIRPGDTGFPDTHNCSYFAPVAFRLFSYIDPSHNWLGVLNTGYTYMATVQNQGNGLFADWTNPLGIPTIPQNNPTSTTYNRYGYESIRIPWRLAWDFHWFNEPRAKVLLDKMANYIVNVTGGDPNQVASNYPYVLGAVDYGTIWSQGNTKRIGTVASTCAMGVAGLDNAIYAANCLNLMNTTAMDPLFKNYFHHILQVMYAQFLNGKYLKPATLPF